MASLVKAPKDFWAGLIYVALGVAFLWIGQHYRLGAASQMGPGYFPRVLSTILIGLGLISLVRSCIVGGEAVSTILWRPMLQITASIVLFGYLLPRAGMVVALLALCLGSAAASREFRLDWKATAGLLALIVFCVLVFVKGLGIPAPIIGTWLQPIITVRWLH